jgi:hypothetical protein
MSRLHHNPKRKLLPKGHYNSDEIEHFRSTLKYIGAPFHKKYPGNYGFTPPTAYRPAKSICDGKRSILKEEAVKLFLAGIDKELFGNPGPDGMPKYVWAIDDDGEVYEAKTDSTGYHGYRLEDEDDWRDVVLKAWKQR